MYTIYIMLVLAHIITTTQWSRSRDSLLLDEGVELVLHFASSWFIRTENEICSCARMDFFPNVSIINIVHFCRSPRHRRRRRDRISLCVPLGLDAPRNFLGTPGDRHGILIGPGALATRARRQYGRYGHNPNPFESLSTPVVFCAINSCNHYHHWVRVYANISTVAMTKALAKLLQLLRRVKKILNFIDLIKSKRNIV